MGKILDLAEELWNGQTDTYQYHPFGEPYEIEKILDGLWIYKGFSNTIIRETPEGLIIIDPAAQFDSPHRYMKIRSVTQQKVHSIVFTHGHVDHAFGVKEYYRECKKKHWENPLILSHVNLPKRFDRYQETHGYNAYINQRQFLGGQGQPYFPIDFIYPTFTFHDSHELVLGDVTAKLQHGKGETDDAVWVYFSDISVLCTGDFFIWSVPNGGNPQKVQRYIKEWADTLLKMAKLEPKILLPGHGVPIVGKERVQQALVDTSSYLSSIHSQTLDLMNKGFSLSDIIRRVEIPVKLSNKSYLQPVYDEPEFLIRNIWRLNGGWYDGIPSHLKPASEEELARVISSLAGGPDRLAKRALELAVQNDLKLACHLVEWALMNNPDNKEVKKTYEKIFTERVKSETSTMAVGIYLSAIRTVGANIEEEIAGNNTIFVQSQIMKNRRI